MSAESDVARAVAAQWDATGLTNLLPGGLHLDQLPRGAADLPQLPYCTFAVAQDRPNKFAARTYTAFTRVTFTLYDVNVLGPVVSTVHSAYDWSTAAGLVNKLDFSFNAPNVYHHYTELGTEDETVTEWRRNGQKIRKATVTFVIWTQRLGG